MKIKHILILLIVLIGLSAKAQSFNYTHEGSELQYNITSDTTCSVVKWLSGSNISIPASVPNEGKEYSVTSIGEMAFSGSSMIWVIIPKTVTSISYDAFDQCYGCRVLLYPNTLVANNLMIPSASTAMIAYEPDNILVEDGIVYDGEKTSLICALDYVRGEFTIPNTVISIGNQAFTGCWQLNSVNIPNSVTSIGYSAFNSCSGLTSITIPKSVTSIENAVFYDCIGLTSIAISDSVTSIGHNAFFGCSSLTSITIPNMVTSIGDNAFYGCSSLTAVNISPLVKSIGYQAFSECRGLTKVSVPNSVTDLGNEAFYNCVNLTEVSLSESLKVIYSNTFYNCPIKDLIIRGGEEIQNGAFVNSKLRTVVLPATVKKIGNRAFGDYIEHITINSIEPPVLESFCMGYTSDEELDRILVVCPNKSSAIKYRVDEKWSDFTIVGKNEYGGTVQMTTTGRPLSEEILNQIRTMPGNVTNLKIIGTLSESDWRILNLNLGRCYELDLSELDCTSVPVGAFKDMKRLQMVTLPSNATSLGASAFEGCSALLYVKFGDKTTEIGERAFYGLTNLRFVELPNLLKKIGAYSFSGTRCVQTFSAPSTLEYIGASAFADCPTLRKVDLSASMVNSIESETFKNCTHLRDLVLPDSLEVIGQSSFACTPLNTVSIPNKVKNIGSNAFSKTNLLAVTLPSSVETVGQEAFSGCSLMNAVSMGRKLKEIGARAFSDDKKISNISITADVPPTVSSTAFEGVSKRKCNVAIPIANFWDYLNAPVWGSFSQLNNDLNLETEISENVEVRVLEEGCAQELESIVAGEEECAVQEEISDNETNEVIAYLNGFEVLKAVYRRAPSAKSISLAGAFMKIENMQRITIPYTNNGYRLHIMPKNGADITSVTLDGEELKDQISENGYLIVGKIETVGRLVVKTTDVVSVSLDNVILDRNADDKIYDMMGHVVTTPGLGIYIRNGKKFLHR